MNTEDFSKMEEELEISFLEYMKTKRKFSDLVCEEIKHRARRIVEKHLPPHEPIDLDEISVDFDKETSMMNISLPYFIDECFQDNVDRCRKLAEGDSDDNAV